MENEDLEKATLQLQRDTLKQNFKGVMILLLLIFLSIGFVDGVVYIAYSAGRDTAATHINH